MRSLPWPRSPASLCFCVLEDRQSQEAVRRVHQSSKWGALAAGALECGGERNLYCPIVPLFPVSHHMPARPVHLQVSGGNQPRILFHSSILSSAANLAAHQEWYAHTHNTGSSDNHTQIREVIKTDL